MAVPLDPRLYIDRDGNTNNDTVRIAYVDHIVVGMLTSAIPTTLCGRFVCGVYFNNISITIDPDDGYGQLDVHEEMTIIHEESVCMAFSISNYGVGPLLFQPNIQDALNGNSIEIPEGAVWLGVRFVDCAVTSGRVGIAWSYLLEHDEYASPVSTRFRVNMSGSWEFIGNIIAGENDHGPIIAIGARTATVTNKTSTSSSDAQTHDQSSSSLYGANTSTVQQGQMSDSAVWWLIAVAFVAVVVLFICVAGITAFIAHRIGSRERVLVATPSSPISPLHPDASIGATALMLAQTLPSTHDEDAVGDITNEMVQTGGQHSPSFYGIRAPTDCGASAADFSSILSIEPEVLHVATTLSVLTDIPGVATMRLTNRRTDYPVEYRIDPIAISPFTMLIAAISTEDERAPAPSQVLSASVAGLGPKKMDALPTHFGELLPGESCTIALFITAKLSTLRQPQISISAGTRTGPKLRRPSSPSLTKTIAPAAWMALASLTSSPPTTTVTSPTSSPTLPPPPQSPRSDMSMTSHSEYSTCIRDVRVIVGHHHCLDRSELKIDSEIGRGGFGVVYCATWRSQRVAAKQVTFNQLTASDITRELDALEKLNSIYVVQFFGAIPIKNAIIMVTEYCELGSADKFFLNNTQHSTIALRHRVCSDIARGMEYIIKQNIIHRDLKPANVLMIHADVTSPRPCCKITDFGTARSSFDPQMTVGIGTPIFMAPELFTVHPPSYTQASDVYAYGMSLYQLLSNKVPFHDARSHFDISNMVSNGKRPDALIHIKQCLGDHHTTWITLFVDNVISPAWDQDPKLRPSFEQLILRLGEHAPQP